MATRARRTPPPTMADVLRARGKLGPYTAPAEEPSPPPPGLPPLEEPEPDPAVVRAWASANGIEVAARGPISAALVERFRRATRGE